MKWQHLKVLLINAKNAVKSLNFHNADVKQNIVQRNVRMSIDKTQQEVGKLSYNVKIAARHFMTIPVMERDVSSVRMNVQTNHISKQRSVSAHIVERFLKSFRHRPMFVAQWNVVLQGLRRQIGLLQKNFLNSVSNAERNSRENYPKLRNSVVNFVLPSVKLIHKKLESTKIQVFTVLEHGYRFAKESSFEIITPVKNVDSMESDFMSTIKNLKEMVEPKLTRTSLLFVHIATEFCIAKNTLKIVLSEWAFLYGRPFVVFIKAGLGKSWLEACQYQPH
jgi:hypothetical protein